MTSPAPCLSCAATRRTCCQVSDINITDADLERIRVHTGRDDFHEIRFLVDHYYEPDEWQDAEDPIWHKLVFRADKKGQALRRRPGGDCWFLGVDGCVLPNDVRPLICRIHPYYYSDKGLLRLDPRYCPPGTFDGFPGMEEAAAAFGVSREQAESWRRQLYEELRAGRIYRANCPSGAIT